MPKYVYLSSTDLFWNGTNAQCSKLKNGKMKTGIKIQMSESYLVTSPRPDMICFTPAPADRQHIDHTVRNQGSFLFHGLNKWLWELRQGWVRLFLLLCSTTYSKQPLRLLHNSWQHQPRQFITEYMDTQVFVERIENFWFVRSSASVLDSIGTHRRWSWIDDCLRNSAISMRRIVSGYLVDMSLFMGMGPKVFVEGVKLCADHKDPQVFVDGVKPLVCPAARVGVKFTWHQT